MPAPATTATVHAPHGMVCSIDHLASSAGVAVLRAGGNAVDAAIATSAVLAVTSQFACGMGGDLFALVHLRGYDAPEALQSAGFAGSGADAAAMRAEGITSIPLRGDVRAVTMPGCVDGWLALHDRFGRIPLRDVLAPAREYAADGFPASPLLAVTAPAIRELPGADDYSAMPVRPGTMVRRPGVAAALDAIVEHGRAGFYEGDFGRGLLALGPGLYSPDDLARPIATWVDPLHITAWGHEIWTVPPPSQGYLNLAGAWIASQLALPTDPDDALWAHLLVEAARWAGFDRPDELHDRADGAALLAPDRLEPRATAVDLDRRTSPAAPGSAGGTIYLCAVDADRTGVSLIQSNASGWGAHIVEPATRIFLQDRGIGFSLEAAHPAELAPGRIPPHTLAPALVTRPDGALRAVLGTMGGDSQPQIVLQMLARLLHAGQSPGAVISAPRWRLGDGDFHVWTRGPDTVSFEAAAPETWVAGLAARGHEAVQTAPGPGGYGHAHLIEVADDGAVLRGASDPRAISGAAAAY